jgi:hypothetical protein
MKSFSVTGGGAPCLPTPLPAPTTEPVRRVCPLGLTARDACVVVMRPSPWSRPDVLRLVAPVAGGGQIGRDVRAAPRERLDVLERHPLGRAAVPAAGSDQHGPDVLDGDRPRDSPPSRSQVRVAGGRPDSVRGTVPPAIGPLVLPVIATPDLGICVRHPASDLLVRWLIGVRAGRDGGRGSSRAGRSGDSASSCRLQSRPHSRCPFRAACQRESGRQARNAARSSSSTSTSMTRTPPSVTWRTA